jgi:hypothetical protein
MTIAGGMVCKDGVLVYADTEWTASTLKIQRAKHWILGDTEGRVNCSIAGAGDEDMLRMAIQMWWSALLKVDKPKVEIHDVTDSLEAALQHVYSHHIYPDPRGSEREFGIICGVSTPEEKPVLFKTVGTAVLLSDSYEYIYLGSGSEMAMYLASRLDVRGVPTSVGEFVAAFILWEVKQHVQTCGGNSVIYRLTENGKLKYRADGDVWDHEEYFSAVDRHVQRVRVRAANLELSEEEFEAKLKEFCDSLRALRRARLQKSEAYKDLSL